MESNMLLKKQELNTDFSNAFHACTQKSSLTSQTHFRKYLTQEVFFVEVGPA